jgi:hypothetical protein
MDLRMNDAVVYKVLLFDIPHLPFGTSKINFPPNEAELYGR